MAALNLAREFLTLKGDEKVQAPDEQAVETIRQLARDIDTTLANPD